ncbi:MAG: PQQ-dependent sugar dehydrogenase [Acidobacteria bacterium]|nr:PQQ-dependent sugar dehydrogenase [Acidobacteriota bacterium]
MRLQLHTTPARRAGMIWLCLPLGLLVLLAAFGTGSSGADRNEPNALQQLKSQWPTVPSRVVGAPDPPPPYKVVPVFPKLSLTNPVVVAREPGSQSLWFIDQDPWKAEPRLCRTIGAPVEGAYEVLHHFGKSLAYSIAFHPSFQENGHLFIGSNDRVADGDKRVRITRYRVDRTPPHHFHSDSAEVIIEWESNGHDGAAIAFSPEGLMYVTSGDGTSDSDTNLKGQGLDHLLSKVLRIDVDRPDPGRLYSVPPDNPFVAIKGARPETWAYGFRNPWRMSVDPGTGHVWVGNNGQDLWEQVYLVERGANYGWSVYEGSHIFYANRELGPTPVSKPLLEHPHSEARSMTGGLVYHGSRFPELRGAYIYGDHSTGKIWGARVEGRKVAWHKELADTSLAIVAFEVDGEGNLLVLDYRDKGEGGFYSLEVNHAPDSSDRFPRRLSRTGLFTSVAGHRLTPGMIPYSVNAPLWSDGAFKERSLYLPPADGQEDGPSQAGAGMTSNVGWSFPDRTVLVKSFGFDSENGSAGERRWVETRLLTRQQGEWVGYSYAWNREQTEAYLVGSEGRDASVEIGLADGGKRRLDWRFPSRSECMVCHSRAANFVLGLSTLQMNKEHDYGGVTANQLEALHYLGVLKPAWSDEDRQSLRKQLLESGVNRYRLDSRVEGITAGGDGAVLPAELPFHWSAAFPRLVDPYDPREDLQARARSYLHSNCAQCHVQAGGGNSQISLEFSKSLQDMKMLDLEPLHHKFDIPDARLVAPGDPDRSVLLHRMATRGRGKMPQLATSLVDRQAVELIREWIRRMK